MNFIGVESYEFLSEFVFTVFKHKEKLHMEIISRNATKLIPSYESDILFKTDFSKILYPNVFCYIFSGGRMAVGRPAYQDQGSK